MRKENHSNRNNWILNQSCQKANWRRRKNRRKKQKLKTKQKTEERNMTINLPTAAAHLIN